MKKLRWVSFLICCSLACLNVPAAHGADLANKKEIVKQARAAYYSLRKLGYAVERDRGVVTVFRGDRPLVPVVRQAACSRPWSPNGLNNFKNF